MKLDFESNRQQIEKITDDYVRSCDGLDAYLVIHMDENDSERMLILEKRGIDRKNGINPSRWRASRIGRMFAKEPIRYLLLHNIRTPYHLRDRNSKQDDLHYLIKAEVYPPYPDVKQNEMAVAGLYGALSVLETSTPEPALD